MNSKDLSGGYCDSCGGCLFLWLFLPALVCGMYIAFCADMFYGFVYGAVPSFQSNKLFRLLYFAFPFGACALSIRFRILRSVIKLFLFVRALVVGFVFYSVLNYSGMLSAFACVGVDFILSVPVCELFDRGCAYSETSFFKVYILIDILMLILTCAFILLL